MLLNIHRDSSLQAHNTLGVPAVAACFATVTTDGQAQAAIDYARDVGRPLIVLGGGSNIVLPQRVEALVVQESRQGKTVLETTDKTARLRVSAGENWHDLVSWCLQQGYYGLENLALIPGTVGAAPIQNIGAYGVEIGNFLAGVHVREFASGKTRYIERQDCGLGYRDSVFKGALRDLAWVESVELCLPLQQRPVFDYPSLANQLREKGIGQPTAHDVFDAVVAIRSERLPDPSQIPNAGSFFKNPLVDQVILAELLEAQPGMPHYPQNSGHSKLPAAWLIERCGFKRDDSPVRVHDEHALVIINPEHRSGTEIQALALQIQEAVETRFGISIEQEPRSYV